MSITSSRLRREIEAKNYAEIGEDEGTLISIGN